MSTLTQEDVVQYLGNLSVMQLISLTKELEQTWGVEAKPQFVEPTNLPTQQIETQVEQTEFNLTLVSFPADKKIALVKLVREVLGMGLLDSKNLIEAAMPKLIKEGISKDDAEALKAKFAEVGAVVDIK